MESVVGITKYYKSIFHNKIMYNEIGGILKCIDKIPYAVIKGEPLSLFAYGDFGYRNCNDIDILISRDNIKLLEKMLKQNNFEQKTVEDMNNRYLRILCLSFSHQLLPYKKYFNDLPITIDLNFDVFLGEFTNKCIDIDEFLSDVIYIEVYGYKIKTLLLLPLFFVQNQPISFVHRLPELLPAESFCCSQPAFFFLTSKILVL